MANDWGDDEANDWGDSPAEEQAAPRVGMGDVQASPSSWAGHSNVPAGLLTGDEATDNQMGQNLAARGSRHTLNKRDALGAGLVAASLLAPEAIPSVVAGGAVGGGLFSAGVSQADSPLGVLADTAKGATVGALVPYALTKYVGPAVKPVFNWVSQKMGSAAERAAVRATNADRTAFKRAFGRPANEDKVQEAGRALLDTEGLSLRSPSSIQEGLVEAMSESGKKIGALAEQATKSGAKLDLETAALKALQSDAVAGLQKNTETRALHARVVAFLEDQLSQHGNTITPATAWDIRRQLDPLSKWTKDAPEAVTKAFRAVRNTIDDALGESMSAAGMGQEWSAANKSYSLSKTTKGLADVGAERRAGNRLGSPSEKASAVAGGVAATVANPVAGAAVPAATILLNRLGMPVTARTLDAASKVLAKVPGKNAPPQAVTVLTPEMREIFSRMFGPRIRLATAEDADPQSESHRSP